MASRLLVVAVGDDGVADMLAAGGSRSGGSLVVADLVA